MEEAPLISYVFGLLQQVKLYHWATPKFATHKALDDLHSVLSEKTDLLVESYIGRFKKQPFRVFQVDVSANSDVSKLERFLEGERDKMASIEKAFAKAPELQNIMQEMMAEIDKTLYLIRLA